MIDWMRIFTPGAWIQLGYVNWKYDRALNKALDKHGIELFGLCSAKIGDFKIWVENYPYAYAHPSYEACSPYTLPSIRTRKRIRKMIVDMHNKKWEELCK